MKLKKLKMMSKVLLVSLSLSAIGGMTVMADQSDALKTKMSNAIGLYMGSSNALVNNEMKKVDSSNPSVVPFEKDGRTLVPLRFISENVGARVDWDDENATATVTKADKVVKMKLGDQQYTINDVPQTLDVPAETFNDRTFIPLRAMVTALDKQVFWDDRGLIAISDNQALFNATTEKELIDTLIDIIISGKAPEKITSTPLPTATPTPSPAATLTPSPATTPAATTQTVQPIEAKAQNSAKGTKVTPVKVTASDVPQPENPAEAAIDGKLDTRWSAEGEQWIQVELNSVVKIGCIGMGYYKGTERMQNFEIALSKDGKEWTVVCKGQSSGTSDKVEYYCFPEMDAKYVKINCNQNSVNDWDSIAELEIYKK